MIEVKKAGMTGGDYVYILPWPLRHADEPRDPWKTLTTVKSDGLDAFVKEAYKNAMVVSVAYRQEKNSIRHSISQFFLYILRTGKWRCMILFCKIAGEPTLSKTIVQPCGSGCDRESGVLTVSCVPKEHALSSRE
jgi:hypothetical protein